MAPGGGDRDGVGGYKSPAPGVRGHSGAVFLFPLFPLGLWQQLGGGGEIPPLGVFPAWINPCGAGLQQHRVQGQAPAPSRWGKVCAFPGRGGAAGFEPPPSPCQPLNVSWVPLNPPVGDDSECWAEPCQTHRMHQQCPGRHWGGERVFFGGERCFVQPEGTRQSWGGGHSCEPNVMGKRRLPPFPHPRAGFLFMVVFQFLGNKKKNKTKPKPKQKQ